MIIWWWSSGASITKLFTWMDHDELDLAARQSREATPMWLKGGGGSR
jgi:hypothetical protein